MGLPGSRRNEKNPPPSRSRFPFPSSPPSPPFSPFELLPLFLFRVSSFAFVSFFFAAFYANPCLFTPGCCQGLCFVPFELSTAFDSFWAELAWPLARAQTRAPFNPLGFASHLDRGGLDFNLESISSFDFWFHNFKKSLSFLFKLCWFIVAKF